MNNIYLCSVFFVCLFVFTCFNYISLMWFVQVFRPFVNHKLLLFIILFLLVSQTRSEDSADCIRMFETLCASSLCATWGEVEPLQKSKYFCYTDYFLLLWLYTSVFIFIRYTCTIWDSSSAMNTSFTRL